MLTPSPLPLLLCSHDLSLVRPIFSLMVFQGAAWRISQDTGLFVQTLTLMYVNGAGYFSDPYTHQQVQTSMSSSSQSTTKHTFVHNTRCILPSQPAQQIFCKTTTLLVTSKRHQIFLQDLSHAWVNPFNKDRNQGLMEGRGNFALVVWDRTQPFVLWCFSATAEGISRATRGKSREGFCSAHPLLH